MRPAHLLIQISVACFAVWTLAYHLCLLLSAPAWTVWPLTFFPLLILLAFFRPALLRLRRIKPSPPSVCLWLLALALAVFTLFTNRFDIDDLSFFHRAAAQLDNLQAPFILTHTQLEDPTLPPLSILHVLTSYEPLTALTASALTLDPLWTYQHAGAFVAAMLTVFAYALLYRRLRLSPAHACLASAVAIAFLLVDGNLHRSFGNITLVRLWQGKCILWTTLLPIAALLALDFLKRPTVARYLLLLAAGVSAVGLSGTGVTLFPAALLAVSLASFFTRPSRVAARRLLLLNTASAYPVLLGLAFFLGVFPAADMQVWQSFDSHWWSNLYSFVIGSPQSLIRDLLLLFLLPALLLRGSARRFLLLWSLALVVLFVNPLTGPLVLKIVTPATYWRFAYLFPLPLCAGLLLQSLSRRPPRSATSRALQLTASALALASTIWALQSTVFASTPLKPLTEPRLPVPLLAFARQAQPHLVPTSLILAPEEIVYVLAFNQPRLRFIASRDLETYHVFRNAHRDQEGQDRRELQLALSGSPITPGATRALQAALQHHLHYVVVPASETPRIQSLFLSLEAPSTPILTHSGYTLLRLRKP